MNEKGLAVTHQCRETGIPSASATSVSLVVREILQYAKNIAEAYAIAGNGKCSGQNLFSSALLHLITRPLSLKRHRFPEYLWTGTGLYHLRESFSAKSLVFLNWTGNRCKTVHLVTGYNRVVELLKTGRYQHRRQNCEHSSQSAGHR